MAGRILRALGADKGRELTSKLVGKFSELVWKFCTRQSKRLRLRSIMSAARQESTKICPTPSSAFSTLFIDHEKLESLTVNLFLLERLLRRRRPSLPRYGLIILLFLSGCTGPLTRPFLSAQYVCDGQYRYRLADNSGQFLYS
jgi:hypothetical protein